MTEMIWIQRIDSAAAALALGAREAIREHAMEDGSGGEPAVIFGAALASLLDSTSPGYTNKQGEWWNQAVDLCRSRLAIADEDGYPAWMHDQYDLLKKEVESYA